MYTEVRITEVHKKFKIITHIGDFSSYFIGLTILRLKILRSSIFLV